jgi:hypothetical protein
MNQWGGVISGPLSIPKVYNGHDRTFFMFSWESERNPSTNVNIGNIPTPLEVAGNFSQTLNNAGKPITIKDPYNNNTAFPGDIIPISRFSPVALKLLQFYPVPNRTGVGNNYLASASLRNTYDSFVTRGDHRFSEKDNISVRYGKRFARTTSPFAESNLGLFGTSARDDRVLGGLSYIHLFTPTLLSDFHFGLSRCATRDGLTGSFPTAADIGMAGSTTGIPAFPAAMATINITNYLALGYPNNEPVQFYVTSYSIGDKLTWIKGNHNFKWGGEYARNRFNQPYFNNMRGTMTASGVWTGAGTATNGDAIADLELGVLASSTITQQYAYNYMRNSAPSVFMTDDWRIRHDLTLNLGLRYEVDTPPSDLYGKMTNFLPDYGVIAVDNPASIPNFTQVVAAQNMQNMVVPMSQLGLSTLIKTYYRGFAPRVGWAWRPFASDTTVIRGGYGIFYSGTELNSIRNSLDNTFPIVLAQSFARVTTNPDAITLSNPWNQAIATLSGTTTSSGYERKAPVGYVQEYSFKLEREIGRGMVFEAGFVGSKGTHLGQQYNLNQPYYSIQDYMQTGTFRSPYPQLSTITYSDFRGNSIYNSGQFTLRKTSSRGFFYRISYIYSKSIDDASQLNGSATMGFSEALDIANLGLERARSDFDRGHALVAVYSYPLPVGQGHDLLGNSGKLVKALVSHWQLAGTLIAETGDPFTIEDSSVNAAIGQSTRPNRLAKGYDNDGTGRRGVDYPWYYPADFPVVPQCASRTDCSPDQYGFYPFSPGNAGRNILDGPGLFDIDASLYKNFTVSESKRIQFRAEAFNILNHPNFTLLDRNCNETAAGYVSAAATNTSGGGTNGGGGNRVFQFALKFYF